LEGLEFWEFLESLEGLQCWEYFEGLEFFGNVLVSSKAWKEQIESDILQLYMSRQLKYK
jgi:hypothetical protein